VLRTAAELADKVEQISFAMVAEARIGDSRSHQSFRSLSSSATMPMLFALQMRCLRAIRTRNGAHGHGVLPKTRMIVACSRKRGELHSATRSFDSGRALRTSGAGCPRGGGFGSEALAPLLGLNATRSAHGQDALHIVRRHYCAIAAQKIETSRGEVSQLATTRTERLPRMIHIALPRPKEERRGASTAKLGAERERAVRFLGEPLKIEFNRKQAAILRATLQALLEGEPASP
jgi:hypothetical protein